MSRELKLEVVMIRDSWGHERKPKGNYSDSLRVCISLAQAFFPPLLYHVESIALIKVGKT